MFTNNGVLMLEIPKDVQVKYENNLLLVKGKLGEVSRKIDLNTKVTIDAKGVTFTSNTKTLTNTYEAHLKNAFIGVSAGYKKKLKMIYAHFPMTIEIKGKDITIKNFLGEKQPRKATIRGNVKMEVKGQEVFLSGCDKEAIGATISNIRSALKIKYKDGRVFQDGLYVTE